MGPKSSLVLHHGTRGQADKLLLSPPLAAPSHSTREKKTETQIKSYSAKLIASTCSFPVPAFPLQSHAQARRAARCY